MGSVVPVGLGWLGGVLMLGWAQSMHAHTHMTQGVDYVRMFSKGPGQGAAHDRGSQKQKCDNNHRSVWDQCRHGLPHWLQTIQCDQQRCHACIWVTGGASIEIMQDWCAVI